MDKKPYRDLNTYYRTIFNGKTAKISLDGGFTCPNRDGSLGTGGCIFCSAGGSGDFAESASLSIPQQIARGKRQTAEKWENPHYIAYFQAFTNTYAPVSVLRQKYEEALAQPHIEGLSIATRPDCLPFDVLELLGELAQKTHLWVELGLQTAKEETAKFIVRGYSNPVFERAVGELHKRKIPVVVHLILGLPHETEWDMMASIDYLNHLPIHGVKLQLLHVLQHTPLAKLYERGSYTPLSKEVYVDLVCKCIARLRSDIVVHRLTGDGDRNLLLAPLWSLDKRNVLNTIHRELRLRNIKQGDDFQGTDAPHSF